MNKHHEVTTSDSRTEHEGAAVAQMRAAIKTLETACNDAMHGDYKEAARGARGARDRLYVADIELHKADMAAMRKRPSSS